MHANISSSGTFEGTIAGFFSEITISLKASGFVGFLSIISILAPNSSSLASKTGAAFPGDAVDTGTEARWSQWWS